MDSKHADTVVTDLTVTFGSSNDLPSTYQPYSRRWHRIEKDLYLHKLQQSAWLHIEQERAKELTTNDLVVTDVRVGELPSSIGSDNRWEGRPGGIWLLRSNYTGDSYQAVTSVDVLFGADAVDPRPQWHLLQPPLLLNARAEVPDAQLTVRHGRAKQDPQLPLRARKNGQFKIVQISDTHMVTGPGVCKDAIDADGQPLPESEADPLTIDFLGQALDVEQPDLVILAGDQLDHSALDTQSAIFKVVAPLIKRSIPYAAVFGNHDDEGPFALSRTAQMSILRDLPFSLCQPGPDQVEGVGNYYLQIFAPAPSQHPLETLYFLDSHGQIPSKVKDPDYDPIKQSQIDWFARTSQSLRKAREEDDHNRIHLSLAFMHIPLPEYGHDDLIIKGGRRREPTEGPSLNTHFYNALVKEGVVAVGCGHDHVNDFCGLRPQRGEESHDGETSRLGPWLCYGGGTGFGGYCSYDKIRYHRRVRVWALNTSTGTIRTWKRVEYARERVDELALVENGAVIPPP